MPLSLSQKQSLDQELGSLVLKAKQQQMRNGVLGRKARVALSIDVSYSMNDWYRRGKVQEMVVRFLALAIAFDDDGDIDIFAFGSDAKYCGTVNRENYHECVKYISDGVVEINGHRITLSGTNYAPCIDLVLKHYFGDGWKNLNTGASNGFLGFGKTTGSGRPHITNGTEDPVFHLFVTDGDNSDQRQTVDIVDKCSQLPMFTQFAGFGSGFHGLNQLNNMQGRYVDNAGLFTASDFNISDDELLSRMMNEFPQWLKATTSEGWYKS